MDQLAAGETAERPLFVKWLVDEEGIKWGNVFVGLVLTVATGYLAAASQRAGSDADVMKTVKLRVAQKRISFGHKLQQVGKAIEEGGWEAYERIQ